MNTCNRKSAKASLRGRANREEGKIFENMIEEACEYYRKRGFADIEKTPEPIRQLGKKNEKGQFLACYEKKAQPDFKGTLRNGKSIVFDAKSTTTDRIAVSALSDKQKESLISHERLGAVSGVMLSYGFKDFFFIPIENFLSAKELNNHAYWMAKEAEAYAYRIRKNGIILDFLDYFV